MLENIKSAPILNQGLFVMAAGIAVVFLTLIVFFLLIKLLSRLYPDGGESLFKRLFGSGRSNS